MNKATLRHIIVLLVFIGLCTRVCYLRVISQTAEPEPSAPPITAPTPLPTPEDIVREPVFTNDDEVLESAAIIKSYLEENTDNEILICAILGMFLRESKFHSYRVAHQRANSEAFTAKIDEGLADGSTRDYFIKYTTNVSGGYGLGMWTGTDYTAKLYDFAQEWGTSIGDAEMQCVFIIKHLSEDFPVLFNEICDSKNAQAAGELIGSRYEGTADAWGVGQNAKYFYEMYYME